MCGREGGRARARARARERERQRQTDRQTNRQTDRQTDRQTETDRQTDRQTDRDKQRERERVLFLFYKKNKTNNRSRLADYRQHTKALKIRFFLYLFFKVNEPYMFIWRSLLYMRIKCI